MGVLLAAGLLARIVLRGQNRAFALVLAVICLGFALLQVIAMVRFHPKTRGQWVEETGFALLMAGAAAFSLYRFFTMTCPLG